MTRVQVLVQLDDAQVERLDAIADTAEDNRSELIRRAIDLYVDALGEAVADVRYAEAYQRLPEDAAELETFRRLAAASWPEA